MTASSAARCPREMSLLHTHRGVDCLRSTVPNLANLFAGRRIEYGNNARFALSFDVLDLHCANFPAAVPSCGGCLGDSDRRVCGDRLIVLQTLKAPFDQSAKLGMTGFQTECIVHGEDHGGGSDEHLKGDRGTYFHVQW